jgi:hypothetical protein
MTLATLLTLAASATSAAPPPESGAGVQLAQAQVQVTIVRAAVVRQRSGPEIVPEAAPPQISRRDGKVLVEYQ